MEYNFTSIEKNWQNKWNERKVYEVPNTSSKPKFYVLDMFPYPSGAGLHVGHPLGYIASDIFSRYKRLKGFNVLHPMGYDAFGLPAEQYAIEHGVHPAISTEKNIQNFRNQLDKIGFCYDWSREVNTSKPTYYKWTQWIFLQLFHSFYNRITKKATPIVELIKVFEKEGNRTHNCPGNETIQFSANDWNGFDHKRKQEILMYYRLAYCGYGEVNWCEALGTVLANDEVVNGVSERGGHPVIRKKLRQWYLRITEYADRLLEGLNRVEFSEAMKEMQTNWIGKSEGAEIHFQIDAITNSKAEILVYTTRPDTIFGVDFLVLAPEHELTTQITTPEQQQSIEDYVTYVKSRSERERQAEKKITGCFTGAYALHPFNGKKIPIWISEYVLAGYGTGAIMAVPCGDERDHKFAKHFNIPITNILGDAYDGENANPSKEITLSNSDFLNGLTPKEAVSIVNKKLVENGIGTPKINYRMRDAAFSRQRYWGEPFPIQWKDGVAEPLPESELPLLLPEVESYSPGPNGEGPLANIPDWVEKELETNTMPGYAGSSWYFLRYMDPDNDETFCNRTVSDYWNQVDVYVGGTEHAVGHLLYSRMWTKALYDLGFIGFDEPFRKLVNQGMIQGSSRFIYRLILKSKKNSEIKFKYPIFLSWLIYEKYANRKTLSLQDLQNMIIEGGSGWEVTYLDSDIETTIAPIHCEVSLVDGTSLNIDAFRKWRNGEYKDAILICDDGSISFPAGEGQGGVYVCGVEVEKMSKSKLNAINPDDLVAKYGADTFRMYEMFLGPIELSKPWDTKGIEGVHRFLKKLWRLFFDESKGSIWTDDAPTAAELKVLHKTIKKIEEDTERFSFNTAVSAFMIAVNELSDLQCHKKAILEPLLILLAPYAPHIAEELYHSLDNTGFIVDAAFPTFEEKYVTETDKEYPISINGKVRTNMRFPLDANQSDIEQQVLANEIVQKWMEDKPVKKFIFVKGKMINVVV